MPRTDAGVGSILVLNLAVEVGPMLEKRAGKSNAWATIAEEFSSDACGGSARPLTFYGKPRSAVLQAFGPIVRVI